MQRRSSYGWILLAVMLALSAWAGYSIWLEDTYEVCGQGMGGCVEEDFLPSARIAFGLIAALFVFVAQSVIVLVVVKGRKKLQGA